MGGQVCCQKKFVVIKSLLSKIVCCQKKFVVKKVCCNKKFVVKKVCRQGKFVVKKSLLSKKVYCQKSFCLKSFDHKSSCKKFLFLYILARVLAKALDLLFLVIISCH